MKNIDTAFRSVRTFTLCVTICCFILSCFIIFKSYRFATEAQSKVYVLANGKVLEAFGSERKENIPVEAKDHIGAFHHLFFTLDPDDKVIQSNITKALYLADGSAARQYNNLKESGYYNNIISSNISQQVSVDSIQLSLDRHPYFFRLYGTEKLIRPTTIVTRSLITEGYLRSVARSDNNPHGFLIERWTIIDNHDLKTENR